MSQATTINSVLFSPAADTSLLVIRIPAYFDYLAFENTFPHLNWGKIKSYFQMADQLRCFASELLQKYWLTTQLNILPSQLQIGVTEDKKPYLLKPDFVLNQGHFNISHSGDYVVIAFSRSRCLGVDIELIDSTIEFAELAPVVFSLGEQKCINSANAFFKLWTKKEALIKAMGYGFNHDFFKTTNLNLDTIEHNSQYTIYSQQLEHYFLSLCILEPVNKL